MAEEKEIVETAGDGADGAGEQPVNSPEVEGETLIQALKEALEKAETERDDYLRIAQCTQADFMNYKRLNVSAKSGAYDDGVRDTLGAVLPTIDNLERALEAAKKAGEAGALTDGVEMTLRQMLAALEKLGLTEIPALNEAFDPECHNAVVCCSGGEPGTIQEVFQKGYRARGRNIRCAMVKVVTE
jgi:molecular chaperone GrpE